MAVFLRLVPHAPNVSPVAGLALFSGVYIKNKIGFILPLTILFLSDLLLGFHDTMLFVYGSFVVTFLLGRLMRNISPLSLTIFSLTSSIIFFILTNFGVWLVSGMYELSAAGLINSYVRGIPFFRNTIIGDLVYSFLIFYGYRLVALTADKILVKKKFVNY